MQQFHLHLFYEDSGYMPDPDDDNEDVEVTLDDGRRYSATVFTAKNVIKLMETWKQTGEHAGGIYFCCPDAIIVERITRDVISRVITDLLEDGSFFWALKLLQDD